MTLKLSAAALVLLLLSISHVGCVLKTMHPGHRLVARKCTACHAEPDRNKLKTLNLARLRQIHEGREPLDAEQMAQVQEYANQGDPGDAGDVPSNQ